MLLYFHSSAIHQMFHFLLPCYLSFWFRSIVNYVCLWYCCANSVLFSYCSVVITITCTNIYVFFCKIVSTAKEKERKKGSNLSSYMLSCCVFVFLIVVVFCVYCKKLFYPTIISISFHLTIQSSFSFLIESYL